MRGSHHPTAKELQRSDSAGRQRLHKLIEDVPKEFAIGGSSSSKAASIDRESFIKSLKPLNIIKPLIFK